MRAQHWAALQASGVGGGTVRGVFGPPPLSDVHDAMLAGVTGVQRDRLAVALWPGWTACMSAVRANPAVIDALPGRWARHLHAALDPGTIATDDAPSVLAGVHPLLWSQRLAHLAAAGLPLLLERATREPNATRRPRAWPKSLDVRGVRDVRDVDVADGVDAVVTAVLAGTLVLREPIGSDLWFGQLANAGGERVVAALLALASWGDAAVTAAAGVALGFIPAETAALFAPSVLWPPVTGRLCLGAGAVPTRLRAAPTCGYLAVAGVVGDTAAVTQAVHIGTLWGDGLAGALIRVDAHAPVAAELRGAFRATAPSANGLGLTDAGLDAALDAHRSVDPGLDAALLPWRRGSALAAWATGQPAHRLVAWAGALDAQSAVILLGDQLGVDEFGPYAAGAEAVCTHLVLYTPGVVHYLTSHSVPSVAGVVGNHLAAAAGDSATLGAALSLLDHPDVSVGEVLAAVQTLTTPPMATAGS